MIPLGKNEDSLDSQGPVRWPIVWDAWDVVLTGNNKQDAYGTGPKESM